MQTYILYYHHQHIKIAIRLRTMTTATSNGGPTTATERSATSTREHATWTQCLPRAGRLSQPRLLHTRELSKHCAPYIASHSRPCDVTGSFMLPMCPYLRQLKEPSGPWTPTSDRLSRRRGHQRANGDSCAKSQHHATPSAHSDPEPALGSGL